MNLQSGKSLGSDSWQVQIIKSVGEFIAIPLFIINSDTLKVCPCDASS